MRRDMNSRERQRAAGGLVVQGGLDVCGHVLRRGDAVRDQLPKFWVQADRAQGGMVSLCQRFQTDVAAFQRNRVEIKHRPS